MEYLFIGGHYDGRRIRLSGWRDIMRLPCCDDQAIPLVPPGEWTEVLNMKYESFRPMTFRGESEKFVVYVLEGMSADDALRRLIDSYKANCSTSPTTAPAALFNRSTVQR
jgi:hypothetical protein